MEMVKRDLQMGMFIEGIIKIIALMVLALTVGEVAQHMKEVSRMVWGMEKENGVRVRLNIQGIM